MKQKRAFALAAAGLVLGLALAPVLTHTAQAAPKTRKLKDGLVITDVKVGKGRAVKAGDHVYVNYVGTLANGKKFDSSYDRGEPIAFDLGRGNVIKGWDEGVAGMKVGGKRKLTIPSALAYGPYGRAPVIPPNATLLFTVELMKIGV